MNKIGKFIEKEKNQERIVLFVFAAASLLIHLLVMKPIFGDDPVVKNTVNQNGFWPQVLSYYSTWSSRVFVNGVACFLEIIPPFIWMALDVGAQCLLIHSLSILFFPNQKGWEKYKISIFLFLLYPFIHMSSAGWIATTVTYFWTVVASFFSFTFLTKKGDVSWYQYLLYSIVMLFACNVEQMAVVCTAVLLAIVIYAVVMKQDKLKVRSVFLLLMAVVNLILHLTCPGNAARNSGETGTWNPGFSMLGFVEKLQLGFSETMCKFLFSPNLIYLMLTGTVCYVVFKKYKFNSYRFSSSISFLSCLLVGFFPGISKTVFPELEIFGGNTIPYSGLVTFYNFEKLTAYIPLIMMAFCFLLEAIAIYLSINKISISLLAILLYFCAIGSGMIMGFSPTLYASGMRTQVNTYFLFVAITMIVIAQNKTIFTDKIKQIGVWALSAAAVLNVFTIVVQSARMIEI